MDFRLVSIDWENSKMDIVRKDNKKMTVPLSKFWMFMVGKDQLEAYLEKEL